MRRKIYVALIVLSILGFTLVPQQPAAAQLVPPNRTAFSFSIATFNPSVYTLGLSYAFGPAWDLTFSYSFQSIAGVTGSLLGLGARYHFAVDNPRLSPYIGGGFASIGQTISGFGTVNASGLFIGAGLSYRIDPKFTAYGSATMFSVGGASNNVLDLGVQFRFAPQVSAQLGYINFTGSGAPYLGVTVDLK